jgi:probable F420-dependent oxidoreductase
LRFGVRIPRTGPFASASAIVSVARAAEDLGYDSVTTNDSISFSYKDRYHFSAGTVDAVDEADRPTDSFEAFTSLSYIAGMTSRIRLITTCLVLPWRNPIMVAKQYATIQELSKNRFVLGLCIGNLEDDFRNFQVAFEKRGAIMDEYLEAIRTILSSDVPVSNFEGKYVRFQGEFFPKPTVAPIWIVGGFAEASLRRVAKYGNGWVPVGTPEQLQSGLALVRSYQKELGRIPENFECGPQAFIGTGLSAEAAIKNAGSTVSKFGQLPEMVRQTKGNFSQMNLIGSLDEVSGRIDEYRQAGANYIELKFIARDLADMLEQMKLCAEIQSSFKSR